MRAILPKTGPLLVTTAVLAGDGTIELDRRTMVHRQSYVTETIQGPDGKPQTITRVVTDAVPVATKVRVLVKGCKFFVVSKEGKLEALDADRAAAQLKKLAAVLTGESAEVDPKTLELVKPGTLCVIHLPPVPTAPPPLPD